MANPESLIVPIDICQDVLVKRHVTHFAVYLAMKFNCSGKMRLTRGRLENIARLLGKSERTVRESIKILHCWDWVGYNPNSGYYFVRSFKRVQEISNSGWIHGAKLYPDQLKNIREYLFSAVVGNIIRSRKRGLGAERYRRREFFSSNHPHPADCLPVSVRSLAKTLGLSISTIHTIKQKAMRAGFIITLPEMKYIETDQRGYRELREDFPGLHRRGNKYAYRSTDRIGVNIRIKYLRWKKTEQISIQDIVSNKKHEMFYRNTSVKEVKSKEILGDSSKN